MAPMAAAGVSLLGALAAGLARFGWPVRVLPSLDVLLHGAFMIPGFLGTLIALERAAALGVLPAYLVPWVSAVGALCLLLGAKGAGLLLLVLGSFGLLALYVHIYRIQPALHTVIMGAGAALLAAGNLLAWRGVPLDRPTAWWAGFLVLTIIGERLELSRLVRPPRLSVRILVVACGLVVLGLALTLVPGRPAPEAAVAGTRVAGLGFILQALWGLRQDAARRTARLPGLTRFMALCLLSGYVWLAVAGALWLTGSGPAGGWARDAALHSLFLGFVMSMIFGHAPVILPVVTGLAVPFQPGFYLHLGLLHASLLVRVTGSLLGIPPAARWGGLLNVAAVLLFLALTARAALSTRQAAAS
ncbi:MAG: hypothetical protein DIU69_01325 [Bacillota bacterium]|nr:MAG: hypothetical protein DIU69_01325 [Bacillota bacterium]